MAPKWACEWTGNVTDRSGNGPDLLLEVSPLFLVHQHQVEVVAHAELLVDVTHGRVQVVARQEQANGNGLPYGMEYGFRLM